MSPLAISLNLKDYASTGIINLLLFQCGDRLYTSESDVNRRQILTYKIGPRAERVKQSIAHEHDKSKCMLMSSGQFLGHDTSPHGYLKSY